MRTQHDTQAHHHDAGDDACEEVKMDDVSGPSGPGGGLGGGRATTTTNTAAAGAQSTTHTRTATTVSIVTRASWGVAADETKAGCTRDVAGATSIARPAAATTDVMAEMKRLAQQLSAPGSWGDADSDCDSDDSDRQGEAREVPHRGGSATSARPRRRRQQQQHPQQQHPQQQQQQHPQQHPQVLEPESASGFFGGNDDDDDNDDDHNDYEDEQCSGEWAPDCPYPTGDDESTGGAAASAAAPEAAAAAITGEHATPTPGTHRPQHELLDEVWRRCRELLCSSPLTPRQLQAGDTVLFCAEPAAVLAATAASVAAETAVDGTVGLDWRCCHDIATGGDGGGVRVVAATVVQVGSDGDPDDVHLKVAGMSRRRRFTTRAHVRVISDHDFERWAGWQYARDQDAREFAAAVRDAATFEEAERVLAMASAAAAAKLHRRRS